MRLKDKLIRKDCPACGGEITLGTSSLNKKINCPKCRQTVIIPNGAAAPPEKPAPKKTTPREKLSERPAPPAKAKSAVVAEEPRIFIQNRLAEEEQGRPVPVASVAVVELAPEKISSEKKDVFYCLCNGVIKRREGNNPCCTAPAVCCIYTNQPGS